jgi:hypothetical protein
MVESFSREACCSGVDPRCDGVGLHTSLLTFRIPDTSKMINAANAVDIINYSLVPTQIRFSPCTNVTDRP